MKQRILCILLTLLLSVSGPGTAFAGAYGGSGKTDIPAYETFENAAAYSVTVKGAGTGSDLKRLNMEEAWKYSKGKGVNVAVIDGGANLYDSAIRSNIKGVYNAKNGSTGWSSISNDSHGTNCAKVLVRVAPKVNLYIIQAGSGGYIYGDQVLKGLSWARSKKCRVVSISSGGDQYWQPEYNAIQELYTASSNSALVCASGGNTGKREYHYAASYDNTLSVGAARYDSGKGQYAVIPKGTYNNRMDVVAPGGTTSAAAPFAAGVAALMFCAKPSLTAKECRDIINKTAKDIGKKGFDEHSGYGLIQPLKALKKVKKPAVTLKSKSASVKVGKSVAIKVKSVFPRKDKISYKSSNKKVAKVNSRGKVTGRKPGKAKITVATKSGAKAYFQVTVKKRKK